MELYKKQEPFIQITSFYAVQMHDFDMLLHTHKGFEIMYVTKGTCEVMVKEQTYVLKEHQFILLDASQPHKLCILSEQAVSILNLEFERKADMAAISLSTLYAESQTFQKYCQEKSSVFVAIDDRNLEYALKDLITHLELYAQMGIQKRSRNSYETTDYQYLTQLLFQRMLIELCGCKTQRKGIGTYYVKQACHFIQEHFLEDIRIPMLADHVGINKSYLQTLFVAQMNCTISDYINQKRIEHAVFLLVNSAMPITDIAFHSGYNSRQHFGSTFERFYGISPKTYRNLHQKNLQPATKDGPLRLPNTN